MTRERTAKATYEQIELLAKESLAKHELTVRHSFPSKSTSGQPAPIIGTWRVGAPDSGFHAFIVHVDSGVIAIWGDMGEFVFRHSDGDSLRWLLTSGSGPDPDYDGGPYCDYTLGKVTAAGESRREFMIDDARAFLDQWERDIKAEESGDPCGMVLGVEEQRECGSVSIGETEDGVRVCQSCADQHNREGFKVTLDELSKRTIEHLEHVETVRETLRGVEYDHPRHQGHAWSEVMHEVGYDDPPRCDGWSPSMLWLWQGIKLFRRLYRAKEKAAVPAAPPVGPWSARCGLDPCDGKHGSPVCQSDSCHRRTSNGARDITATIE